MQARVLEFTPLAEKSLPSNIECEEAVLGGILLDPEAMPRIAQRLSPEMFSIDAHSKLYAAFKSLYDDGSSIDLITAVAKLRELGQLDRLGGQCKLAQLVDRTVSTANIDLYAETVREYYCRRELIWSGNEIARLGHSSQPAFDSLQEAREKLDEVSTHLSAKNAKPSALGDILVGEFKRLEDRMNNPDSREETPTGLVDLDNILGGGFWPGEMTVIAGRPSMGKTALAVDLAHRLAKSGRPVLFVSMEMTPEALSRRFICRACADVDRNSLISVKKLRQGKIDEKEMGLLIQGWAISSELPIHIYKPRQRTDGDLTHAIEAKVDEIYRNSGRKIGAVFIDYIQQFESGIGENRRMEVDRFVRFFKQISVDFSVPVILLSQINRGVESRNDKRPMMSDAKESSQIEQEADNFIGLYRDGYYNPDSPDKGLIEAILLKGREVGTGVVKLLGRAESYRLDNYAPARI